MAAPTLDLNELIRDACVTVLAEHIRTRLAQTGRTIAKGSCEVQARWFVNRWTNTNAAAFYLLAKTKDRFLTHTEIAIAVSSEPKVVRDFWSRTLQGMQVAAHHSDTKERADVRLFRRDHEMTFSNRNANHTGGIKLQVRTEMLNLNLAQLATDTTRTQTAALMQNYEGAARAQETAANDVAGGVATARELLHQAVTPIETEKNQTSLFGEAKK